MNINIDHKAVDKITKNTQDNFEYILNQAHTPFAILTGRNFLCTFANAAYVQLTNGRQLTGKELDEALPGLKGQPFVLLLEKVFDSGVPYHDFEIPVTAMFSESSGPTTKYFNFSYTPYKNPAGETEGILVSGYDITYQLESKKIAYNKALNIQAYKLFMQAPLGFSLVMGDDHVLTLANATGLGMTGKGEEIIGKPVAEIIPGIERQGYIDLLNSVKHSGEIINLKESPVVLIKDGKEETIYVNLIYQPYYEGKDIAGVLSISTDVTKLVLARKEAVELKEQFETMVNNIPNLAWIANSDGWIFWYNNRWYEYTGTTPEEMEGWGWQSVHDPEKLTAVLEEWQHCINSGRPFEMVFPLRGADNSFRQFLTRVNPVRNNDGKIIHWLGTNTDITKQKEVERMKDDFLSIASHELKTPVTTIKIYVQIVESMLEMKGDTQMLGMIKKMNTQVNRLTTLIEDLLDIQKIQHGKLVYDEAFYDFSELVREVIDDMQKTTSTHLIINNEGKNEKIFGDRNKLSQVLNNLISNAIKYSPSADKIIVACKPENNGIQLSVQDFGIGIPAREQQHVFEQFYRVSGDNQSTFPGMGIGLYICSEIITGQRGKIWVESIVDKGSVFYIWLPLDHRDPLPE